jgi:hypothetical protein
MSPNRVPEKRVGTALILIGGFSLVLYIMNSAITKNADPVTFFLIVFVIMIGVGLRRRFKDWGLPPPPPPKAAPKPAAPSAPAKAGGIALPFGKKPAPPPPAAPNRQPPPPIPAKPKGFLGRLDELMKPKNKK